MRTLESRIRRGTPDGILDVVAEKGRISIETAARLCELLTLKTTYDHHIEVAVVTGGLLKVIDNEEDALETIRRLERKT